MKEGGELKPLKPDCLANNTDTTLESRVTEERARGINQDDSSMSLPRERIREESQKIVEVAKEEIEKETNDSGDRIKNILPAEELGKGWGDFTRSNKIDENGLVMIREMDTHFEDMSIILSSDKEFYSNYLNDKLEIIRRLINEFYSSEVNIKIYFDEYLNAKKKKIENTEENIEISFKTKDLSKEELFNKHPIEQFIVTNLEAKEQVPNS